MIIAYTLKVIFVPQPLPIRTKKKGFTFKNPKRGWKPHLLSSYYNHFLFINFNIYNYIHKSL